MSFSIQYKRLLINLVTASNPVMDQTFMDREVGVLATWNIASRGFGSCRREYSLDEFIWYFHQRGPMDPALVEQSMTLLPRRPCRISDKGQLARVRLLVGPYGGRDPHRSDGLIPRSPKCKFGPDYSRGCRIRY